MGFIWKDRAKEIIENGIFIANTSNWDIWEYEECLYSIPIYGSGCCPSVWCGISNLKKHLSKLKNICNHDSLIPKSWKNVNYKFLEKYGINKIPA